ncbi:MAG TPA: PDR/VanB family oxidoreductase [Inquilinus sp.]|nr:PDR/VanB family oxidoreductase [Inquilinus sp.]
MPKLIHRVTTIVRRIRRVSDDVLSFELADPDDWELPPFTAGAHIDVHLPNGAVRQYSLHGDPAEANRYRIAVKREAAGRGGSACLHRDVAEGSILPVSLPRNHFPLAPAPHHVLIAGGIGITPFLSMIPALAASGDGFELHYCTRTPSATPFLEQLAPLATAGRVRHHFSRGEVPAPLDIAALIARVPPDAHVYCCGPAAMIRTVQDAAGPQFAGRLHAELFGRADGAADDSDFTVELARSGRRIPVPRGQTMLAALREAGVEIGASCEAGICLDCKTRYLSGTPVHRDLAMRAADRTEFITPCVSGCAGPSLVLDL